MAPLFNELPEEVLDRMIARERGRVIEPLTEWQTLSALLREEGVIGSSQPVPWRLPGSQVRWARGAAPWYRHGVAQAGVRLFAGVVLLGVGVLAGHLVTVTVPGGWGDHPGGVPHGRGAVASEKTVAATGAPFRSPEEARRRLAKAQDEYQRAVAYLAASDTTLRLAGNPSLYRERLAALDKVVSATQRALKDAPQDPLLNHYYLSTMSAREATVQQLNQTLPVGSRVSHF